MGQHIPGLDHQQISDISQEIEFSRQLDDPFFGPIQIYRRLVPPFDYIMKHQHLFYEGQHRKLEQFSTNMKTLLQIKHPNLSQIHSLSFNQEKLMCFAGTKVSVYWDYFNYTLRHCATRKIQKLTFFAESELIYIFDCLVSVACILKDSGIVLGDYRSDRLFVSPEGKIRIYLPQILRENQHSASYRSLTDKQVMSESILSPQQLYYISRMEQEPSLNIYRSEVFAIGMILLELLSLSDFRKFYRQEKARINTKKIKETLHIGTQIYSPGLIDLVNCCLQERPSDRITMERVHERLQALKKGMKDQTDCIKLKTVEISPKNREVFAEIRENQEKIQTDACRSTGREKNVVKIRTDTSASNSLLSSASKKYWE